MQSDASGRKGLLDNLRFLKYIDEQKKAGYFPNVYVIDCTDGEIPKRHMGLVRGLGQLVAENRLDQTQKGEGGVIIQLDADVSVTPDFVITLLEAYQRPSVHSAMIGRIPLPIDFPSDDYYLNYAIKFAQAVVSGLVAQTMLHVKFQGDGPTLSFRAFLHKEDEIRGYMEHSISEDFALGDLLLQAGQMYLLAEPRVYKGDRVRPDGFDSAIREHWPPSAVISFQTPEVLIRSTFKGLPFSKEQFQSMPPNEFWQMAVVKLGQQDPETMSKLRWYLVREEELARRRMDWDRLNPSLRNPALHIYAFSRLAMGESQMLPLRPKLFSL